MRKRSKSYSDASHAPVSGEISGASRFENALPKINENVQGRPKRSTYLILALFVLVVNGSWAVHYYQFETLPDPLTSDQAGKRGFSEEQAMKHVKALVELGPHPIGSDALDVALKYVLAAAENIKKISHWEVDVDVDFFHVNSGSNRMVGGLFKGKTLVYSDLKHVVLRISPRYDSDAVENAILVSSHIDTVYSAEGAGDCSSCVAVMLELARGISQWAHGFKNSVIFLFNTGEEEGLNGAHSFITQHPWSSSIHMAIDFEAMGIGGKSSIFQAGPDPWAIENFAMVAKYPSGQIIAQDLFSSGAIKSATDFQVYKEVAGLSGLDFAYVDNTAVYHTKNDKLELLKSGSLQHLGENMLAFLLQVATKAKPKETDEKNGYEPAIYFDILGKYMIVFHQRFATMLYNSVIMQSLMIWATSVIMGGYTAAVSLALSFLSILLMWICSLSFSAIIAYVLLFVSSWPVLFVSSPLLAVGLFGGPALLGALTGQHLGYLILVKYLSNVFSKKKSSLSVVVRSDWAKLDAERWLYKAGLLQWLVLLIVGNYYRIGSSYIALVWLVSPAFAYGLLEATLSSARLPKPLKTITLLLGLFTPFLISAGMLIRLAGTLVGTVVRLERNPGNAPEWIGNVVLGVYISAVICLTLVYLLSYVHISGSKTSIVVASCILFFLSLAAVLSGIVPPFTKDTSRAVNVVHVVDKTGRYSENQEPSSYVSLYSLTPGKLTKEAEQIGEGFVCGNEKVVDLVTYSVKYSCWTHDDVERGWNKFDIPTLDVTSDVKEDERITKVLIDTRLSTRWSLAINTKATDDFRLSEESGELIPLGDKSSVDGWHTIQFSGGTNALKKFELSLFWVKNYTDSNEEMLLKLRTDVDRLTPKAERVLKRLPSWCSLFGKSTSPYNLAFLTSLPVHF